MKNLKSIFKIFCLLIIFTLTNITIGGIVFSDQNIENIAWQKVSNGLYGGVVTSICVDSTYKNVIYAGTIRGGIYVSKDSGLTWNSKNNGLKNLYIHSLLSINGRIFAGTEDFIFISDDLGENWSKTTEDLKEITVNTMKVAVGDNSKKITILAGTNRGLYISNDGGLSWIKSELNTPIDVLAIEVDPNNSNVIFISGRGTLFFKSEDSGNSWRDLRGAENLFEFQTMLIDSRDSQIIYGGTSSKGVWKSSNGGRSFISVSEGLENLYISAMLQKKDSNEIFASTYGGLFVFSESNNTWQKVGFGPFNENIMCITYIENIGFICGTNGGGIFLLRDVDSSGIWQQVNTGLDNIHIRSIKCFGSGERLLAATWGAGIFKSIDFGNSWTQQNSGITNPLILCIESNDKNLILAGTYNGGIYKSINYGDTWEKFSSPTLLSRYIYSISFDQQEPKKIFAGTDDGIFRSVNEGESWARVFSLASEVGNIKLGEIVDIEISRENPKVIFAASYGSGVYVSRDGGDSWLPANSGLGNLNILSIKIDQSSKNVIYASSFGGGIYKSNDFGASWTQSSEGLANSFVYNIFINPSTGNLYASTEAGVYESTDKGESWNIYGAGLENISIREVCYNPSDLKLYAGTYGNGAFKSIRLPGTPVPMSPQNESKIVTLQPTLTWSEVGGSDAPYTYTLQISIDQTFLKIVFERTGITGNQFITPVGVLEKGKAYFWRIKVSTQFGDSNWSIAYKFYTVTKIVLRIGNPLMEVDSETREIDPGRGTTPVIKEGRTFLPIRSLIETLSGNITWNDKTKKVVIELKDINIELTIGSNMAIVNGKKVQIDPENAKVTPFIANGRTMLPLRFIAENLGAEVNWEAPTQTITIIYPAKF